MADVFGYIVEGEPAGDGAIKTQAPQRVLDTRPSVVAPGQTWTLGVVSPVETASAAIVNVTAVGGSGSGFITVSAPGAGTPNVSQLSFGRANAVAAQVIAPVDASGQVRLTVSSTSSVQLIVDVSGWVLGAPDTASLPPAVTGLVATPATGSVKLTWEAPSAAAVTGYLIRRHANQDAPDSPYRYVQVGTTTTPTFTDVRVAPGVAYNYAVFARNASGDYSEAAVTSATIPGSHWNAAVLAAPERGLATAVSCPTTTWCTAVDHAGKALIYNGSTWGAPKSVVPRDANGVDGLIDVSCPTTTFCFAIVDQYGRYAVYRSGVWTVVTGGQMTWKLVDCHSATRCALVGESPFGTHTLAFWNGSGVTNAQSISGLRTIRSVSCPSQTMCLAAGISTSNTVTVLRASGTGWVKSAIAAGDDNDAALVSCSAATFCLLTTSYSKGAWRWNGAALARAASIPGYDLSIESLSCTSATFCQGVGEGRVGRWNGSTWTLSTLSTRYTEGSGWAPIRSLDCASSSMCLTVDSRGRFTRWGGAGWSPLAVFDPTSGSMDIELTCTGISHCMGSDRVGNVYTWNGVNWSSPVKVNENHSLVSCVSTSWCFPVRQA